jgi:hypothetical protein
MCLRGRIEPSVGEACPICSSTVERILEVAPGGAAKPARKHKDHSVQTGRQHPEAGTAALLEPLSSQKARR